MMFAGPFFRSPAGTIARSDVRAFAFNPQQSADNVVVFIRSDVHPFLRSHTRPFARSPVRLFVRSPAVKIVCFLA